MNSLKSMLLIQVAAALAACGLLLATALYRAIAWVPMRNAPSWPRT